MLADAAGAGLSHSAHSRIARDHAGEVGPHLAALVILVILARTSGGVTINWCTPLQHLTAIAPTLCLPCARAEPVSALYEQRKVSHARAFSELEDQLCTWEPLSGDPSPDRLDALVWALTDLFLRGAEPLRMVPAYVAGRPRNIPGQ